MFAKTPPLFWLLSMEEITVCRNLHKHASPLPPLLFLINEISLAFAHIFKNVIAANCLSLPKLEVALFDVCFNILKVMELSFPLLPDTGSDRQLKSWKTDAGKVLAEPENEMNKETVVI